jgi:hypothetical protein
MSAAADTAVRVGSALDCVTVRGRGLIVVLVVTGLLGSAALASGSSLPRGGDIFDATADSGHGEDAVLNQFEMRISRDGRNVTVPGTLIGVSCTAGPSKGNGPELNVPTTRARIGAGGTLSMMLATNDGGRAPMTLTGKFVSAKRFSGTLTFSGGRQDPNCDARLKVIARLRILTRYRTDQFVGLTTAGNRLSFYRTIAPQPLVGGLNVPSVMARCPGGGTEGKAIVTGRGVVAAVRHGAFRSDDAEDEGSEAFTFAGRFTNSTTAAGTLGLSGRDDCSISALRWTATRVGPGPMVTVVSH